MITHNIIIFRTDLVLMILTLVVARLVPLLAIFSGARLQMWTM